MATWDTTTGTRTDGKIEHKGSSYTAQQLLDYADKMFLEIDSLKEQLEEARKVIDFCIDDFRLDGEIQGRARAFNEKYKRGKC